VTFKGYSSRRKPIHSQCLVKHSVITYEVTTKLITMTGSHKLAIICSHVRTQGLSKVICMQSHELIFTVISTIANFSKRNISCNSGYISYTSCMQIVVTDDKKIIRGYRFSCCNRIERLFKVTANYVR